MAADLIFFMLKVARCLCENFIFSSYFKSYRLNKNNLQNTMNNAITVNKYRMLNSIDHSINDFFVFS